MTEYLLQTTDGRDVSARREAFRRPALKSKDLGPLVSAVMQEVKANGDEGIQRYNHLYGAPEHLPLRVTAEEMEAAEKNLDTGLKNAIRSAASQIKAFHLTQCQEPQIVETIPGVKCWRKSVGIEKVGLYIPGGTAPLFSTVLMLGIPAMLAGCGEIILCSPPDNEGKLHPAILFAARLCGITAIIKAGGAQAIAALTFGAASVPAVFKIFGPGNQYVTEAKKQAVDYGVAIDMPAGPSEVLVIADETAHPGYVAADLLSQCEHGADSQCILIACAGFRIKEFQECLARQLERLPRKKMAAQALTQSRVVLAQHSSEALIWSNEYAPEHLILHTADAEHLAEKVVNAGSVFLGAYSPESAGDYASGTNHTLPTNGFARNYSGVSVDSFVKKITFQQLSQSGLEALRNTIETMASAEGLTAHASAVSIRFNASYEQ